MRLTVRVIRARKLPAIGRPYNSYLNPCVELQLGKQRFKTKVIKSNPNPTWDQEFSFLVGDVKDVLKLDVYDQKYLGTEFEFLGQLRVPMEDVLAADDLSLGTRWYQLLPKGETNKAADCGEISVSISLEPFGKFVFPETPFSELLKSLESRHEGVDMPVNLQGILVDQSYLASPTVLNYLLFSPDSDFKQTMVELIGYTDFKTEPWRLDNDGECLKRVVTYRESPKVPTFMEEEQSYLKADGKEYAVLFIQRVHLFRHASPIEILFRIMPGPELDSQQQTSHLVVSWRLHLSHQLNPEHPYWEILEKHYAQFSDLLSQKIKPIEQAAAEDKPIGNSSQMDEATKHNILDRMLLDASAEPTDLPLSLLKEITNDFSNNHEVGRGGFAVVYKGLLQNGTVAVKKLSQILDVVEKNFQREVECLMRVNHKNIVRFLGYCGDTQMKICNYEGNLVMADVRERLLCFEFVPNGNLQRYITDASEGLEWSVRYQLIKGICEGLHYLHHQNQILHLDLKPANVLIDHNMVPKIADFGLSRCFDENQSHAITSKLVGSLGYMAPEFFRGEIRPELDIYSLGVIIMEILTGQKGYSEIEDVLKSWSSRFGTSQGDTLLEQVRVCAEIGLQCIEPNPRKRRTTQCILQKLDEMESRCSIILN